MCTLRLPWSVLPLAVTIVGGAAVAQERVWKLPPAGYAAYERVLKETTGTAPDAADARTVDPATAGLGSGWTPLRASVLPEGRLNANKDAVDSPVRDLRDLPSRLACDLRITPGRRVRMRLARVAPFGDLVIRGSALILRENDPDVVNPQAWDPVPGAVVERLELSFKRQPIEAKKGERSQALRSQEKGYQQDAQGTLTILRQFDPARGLVTGFHCDLDAVLQEKKGDAWRRIVIAETWKLIAVHENQDVAFKVQVTESILKGVKGLRDLLKPGMTHRAIKLEAEDSTRTYHTGKLALILLTLLHADLANDDPLIVELMTELRGRRLYDTYSTANALMAMEKFYAPPQERDDLLSGRLARPAPRKPSPSDLALMQGWVDQLMHNLDQRVDPGYLMRWDYIGNNSYDNSLNQYGLLGLYSAQLCGVEVRPSLWIAAANHFLDDQEPGIGKVYLDVQRYGEEFALGGRRKRAMPAVEAAGWSYKRAQRGAYGSMTAAGITGLSLAKAALLELGQGGSIIPKIDKSMRSGFAWLGENFSVRINPGPLHRHNYHWYYYLYSLERACELSGIARLKGRDWYQEAALELLATQRPSGRFESGDAVVETCFALLLLKKAALPVLTSKRPKKQKG